MLGNDIKDHYPKLPIKIGDEVLVARNINTNILKNFSFSLNRGEILGVAGLVGSGRTSLVRVIAGQDKIDSGQIIFKNKIKKKNKRIGYIPENRDSQAMFNYMDVASNLTISDLNNVTNMKLISYNKEKLVANDLVNRFGIHIKDIKQKVLYLSGGNKQKVLVARCFYSKANIYFFDEPTKGVDMAGKVEIYNIMNELIRMGGSILMVSSDFSELVGMCEMTGQEEGIRKVTDHLDSVGNTTAAIGKGFSIASAALTSLALFTTYANTVGLGTINVLEPRVIVGLLIGGMLPYLFSALTIGAVSEAAKKMIAEVRRQFREIAGIMEGKAVPEYSKCVDISTSAALRQMILPGIIVITAPILIGLLLGKAALAGLLVGATVTGVAVAIKMANSGGAWDNAKKHIEEGAHEGKNSHAHKASVIGDTVGDPLKDTAGPSINILIKIMSIVAVVFAPLFMA